jgi:hypothetical protein
MLQLAWAGNTFRNRIQGLETNKLFVLNAFYCHPEHANRRVRISLIRKKTEFFDVLTTLMHKRRNPGKNPDAYNHTALNNYVR